MGTRATPFWRELGSLLGLTAIYVVAGNLGLRLAFAHPSATPVWVPTAIALVAFLVLGLRVWPAIFLGAFLVNLTTEGTALTSVLIAAGNTLEGIIGSRLVNRWAGGTRSFDRAESAFLFVLLAGGVGTTVSATIGVTTLAVFGFAPWADYSEIWLTWWLGDAAGAVVFAPAILLWVNAPRVRWNPAKALEALGLAAAIALTGVIVFSDRSPFTRPRAPSQIGVTPVIMWAALRFGQREAATAMVALAGIAIAGTVAGYGPFVWGTPNESLLLLQAFMGVTSATTIIVSAAMAERRVVERQLREWSLRDPLTGLVNYREMVAVLEGELRRSGRTERTFALLVLDLDDLKGINDRDGHLAGNRSLRRLAAALERESRAVDTTVRFGGDEFAVVMPESGEREARQLALRIAARLASDDERPAISASIGVAVCPHDGDSVESLIGHADAQLYYAKRLRKGAPPRKARTPS